MIRRLFNNIVPTRPKKKKTVTFASNLETVYDVQTTFETSENFTGECPASSMVGTTSQLTKEIMLLSSEHGRARRHLREIPKYCLQAAVKYGIKTPGQADRKTGLPRWKYTFGNIVFITDYTSQKEVTCYKQSISIKAAPISVEMIKRHGNVKRIIKEDPHMCTSHFVIIVDQSGSMKCADVNGFRNRSQASYGCLALDCVAEQLTQVDGNMAPGIDTLTLIEMNDNATIIYEKEPLDWLLFNKLLKRQSEAKPRSHGNYGPSILQARQFIKRELNKLEGIDHEDLPGFALILLSDGKPSDNEAYEKIERISEIDLLSTELKDKFTFLGMGIGADGSDFTEIKKLSRAAETHGGKGEFKHAGLSAANLGDGFSKIASSMSTVRSGLLSKTDSEAKREDEAKIVVPLKKRQSFTKSRNDSFLVLEGVSRFRFQIEQWEIDRDMERSWLEIEFQERTRSTGFMMDNIPFGKGQERLAYRFQEVNTSGKLIGKRFVAKETKGIHDETKKFLFHMHFCRIQTTATYLSKEFNKAMFKTPSLKLNPPKIEFVKCSIYQYINNETEKVAVLVEKYLYGKFIKYNGNNGYVNKDAEKDSGTMDLDGAEVHVTDFLQAFSHWTYVFSDQNLLLCDLQGVFNREGLRPKFILTDPAICSIRKEGESSHRYDRYGGTDIRLKGIRQFFRSHKCNLVCECLGLPGDFVND